MRQSHRCKSTRKIDPRNVALTIAFHLTALGGVILFTWLYVSSETGIYWWDYANYQNITHRLVRALRQSPLEAIRFLQESLSHNYNAIFAIPLLPILMLLGESRLTFEIGLVLVYLLPFAIIMGNISKHIVPNSRFGYWAGIIITLLTPPVWAPTLRGYPDIGALACIALAVFFLIELYPDRVGYWRPILAGTFLGIAILLRRHFVYPVIGFFVSWLLFILAYVLKETRGLSARSVLRIFRCLFELGLGGCATVLILVLIGKPFLRLVLTTNFSMLYASYTQPWQVVLTRFASSFGWLIWGLAIVGWSLGMVLSGNWQMKFVCLFASLSSFLWIFVGRQLGNHYSLHFAPFVIQGLIILGVVFCKNLRVPFTALLFTLFVIILCVNFGFGLLPIRFPTNSTWRVLFAQNWPPIRRNDTNELVRLVRDLREMTQPSDLIYVASSSSVLNSDLLSEVEKVYYGWEDKRLNLISYDVDSKHPYPIDALFRSQIVVVAVPLQIHLNPEQQGLVRSVFDLFTNKLYIAQDFALLPQSYVLDDNVSVYLYKRTRPTDLDNAIYTLEFIRRFVPRPSIAQPKLVVLAPLEDASILEISPNEYKITISTIRKNQVHIVFLDSWKKRITVWGHVIASPDCPKIFLNWEGFPPSHQRQSICNHFCAGERPSQPCMFSCSLPHFKGPFVLSLSSEGEMGVCSSVEVYVNIIEESK
jgi:hypothetical protein